MLQTTISSMISESSNNPATALYVSDLKARSIQNDFIALIFGRVIPAHCVKISDGCENVLEIDLVRAWKETDSEASVSIGHCLNLRWTGRADL